VPASFSPMPLVRVPEPFDHPDWISEVKHDGFRALAHVKGYECCLVSHRGHVFPKWDVLCDEIAHRFPPDCSSVARAGFLRILIVLHPAVPTTAKSDPITSTR
jgi:ATP-dependent DNA ligase